MSIGAGMLLRSLIYSPLRLARPRASFRWKASGRQGMCGAVYAVCVGRKAAVDVAASGRIIYYGE